jgi:flagellar FliL protein
MATQAAAAEAPAAGGGKKKLIIVIAAVLLLVLIGGGAAVFLLKKKAPADGEEGEDAAAATHTPAAPKVDPKHPPVFVPLDPFTVNLADKEVDRFAQIGITLEVADAKTGDMLKNFMPAIRGNILMLLSHKSAVELLTREGKEKLAREINRESVRPLGIELEDEEEEAAQDDSPKKKKKKKKAAVVSPILNVHFSTFIVQ